jgi:hypothetical protein
MLEQLSLPFSDAAGTAVKTAPVKSGPSKAALLRLAVEDALGPVEKLIINDNRHHLLSVSFKAGLAQVRIHQMFLDASAEVRVALSRYLKSGHRASGKVVDAFIEENEHLLTLENSPLPKNAHVGAHHDLLEIFNLVNAAYFKGQINAEITWGQAGRFAGRRRRSIKLGSYDAQAKRITIHPALDQEQVPGICVARVVHHEMLHQVHPMKKDSAGRRIMHPPSFKKDEALFDGAGEADGWLDDNLDMILGFKPGQKKRRKKSGRRS